MRGWRKTTRRTSCFVIHGWTRTRYWLTADILPSMRFRCAKFRPYSLLVPMMRSRHLTFHGVGGVGIVPVELNFDSENTSDDVEGSLLLAKNGGNNANLFGKLCQKSLCMESWDFVLDAINYETVSICLTGSPSRISDISRLEFGMLVGVT